MLIVLLLPIMISYGYWEIFRPSNMLTIISIFITSSLLILLLTFMFVNSEYKYIKNIELVYVSKEYIITIDSDGVLYLINIRNKNVYYSNKEDNIMIYKDVNLFNIENGVIIPKNKVVDVINMIY